MGVAGNIREHALEIFTDTHGRIGHSPEKPQIFLYLFVVVYSRIKENTLQVTPTAKRNSYRVAILVGRLPRVACFARNPGLRNRNSYRVARGAHRLRGDNHTWLLVCISSTTTKLCITLGEHFIHCGITIHGGKGAHHRQRTNHA